MTKRKANPQKGGRPSSYDAKVHPNQVRKLCLLGATNAELADFFGISTVTLNTWMNSHPEFLNALKEGKELADADVSQRLYERAMGYSHEAVKIFADPKSGAEKVVTFIEHYPPDTTACIFWLKNRQPDRWRDKIEHTGPNGGPIGVEIVRYTEPAKKG